MIEWCIITFPFFWFGIGKKYPFSLLGPHGDLIGVGVWFLATLFWIAGWVRCTFFKTSESQLRPLASKVFEPYLWIAAFLLPLLDLASWLNFKKFGYTKPLLLWAVDVLWILFLFFRLSRPKWKEIPVTVALTCFLAALHQIASIYYFPLSSLRSDMLPLIQLASQNLLSGFPAYSAQFGSTGIFMCYPPGMLLTYFPVVALGLDPRWLNPLLFGLLGKLAYDLAKRNPTSGMLTALWFSNPYLLFRHELYLHAFWIIAILATLAALHKKFGSMALWGAVAFSSMIWSLVCLPFWALLTVPSKKISKLVQLTVIVTVIGSLGHILFYLKEREIFLWGVSSHFRLAGSGFLYADFCLGLSPLMIRIGLGSYLYSLQRIFFALIVAFAFWSWFKSKNARNLLIQCFASALFGFIMLSPIHEAYHFLLPVLLVAWLGAALPNAKQV